MMDYDFDDDDENMNSNSPKVEIKMEGYNSSDVKKEEYTKLCKDRSAAFFRVGKEPKKNETTNYDLKILADLESKLKQFKSDNNWEGFLGERFEV